MTGEAGRAGFIVPTGIATDDSTKAFFASISSNGRLVSLLCYENEEFIFPSVHHAFRFGLMTLRGKAAHETMQLVFFARQPAQIHDPRRRFTLMPEEFRLINPNTLTCPVFRSERDAELTKKLYRAAPVLIEDSSPEGNPWRLRFHTRLVHMAEDSHLFSDAPADNLLPLYEAKMIHQFDHRWSSYFGSESRDVSVEQKGDPEFTVTSRYWVDESEVNDRFLSKGWKRRWVIGWRDITGVEKIRTVIATKVPRVAVGHTIPVMMPFTNPRPVAALLGNLASLTLDFAARVKVGGTHLTFGYLKQFPVLSPNVYTEDHLAVLIPRILELTYTAHDLHPWAADLGYDGPPFRFDPDRRALLRAELDAYYARLYGLTRDELRYILDPAEVMGADYPSETFRVLKKNELREHGEYRTRRLVLEAWDELERGSL